MRSQNKFNLDYRVGFGGLLPDSSLGLPALMGYVQECSLFHTHSIPGAFAYYDEMNWVWILTHWQVEINGYPKVADIVNVSTWPVRFRGYFGERGFDVLNAAGDTLLTANSNWILLDRSSFKPIRPTEFICQKYGERYPFDIPKDFTMPSFEGAALLSVHVYTAGRRDIDTNRHVNNAKYLEWMYGYLPDDIYRNYRAKSLKVSYKKEALLGDELEIRLYKRQKGEDIEIFALIEKQGRVATEIYTTWNRG